MYLFIYLFGNFIKTFHLECLILKDTVKLLCQFNKYIRFENIR